MATFSERIRMRAAPRLLTSSIFRTVKILPLRFEDFLDLVGRHRIQAAAERIELHQLQIS